MDFWKSTLNTKVLWGEQPVYVKNKSVVTTQKIKKIYRYPNPRALRQSFCIIVWAINCQQAWLWILFIYITLNCISIKDRYTLFFYFFFFCIRPQCNPTLIYAFVTIKRVHVKRGVWNWSVQFSVSPFATQFCRTMQLA